ncbi:hypothetical protein JC200_22775 [Alicyclobacillus sp. ALC3]|nr:hypothetical protein JC200_22775 [Alicyclobacillus sp. ALC3]
MNYHKKGLKQLLNAILQDEVGFAICEAKDVEVVILNQGEDSTFEEDLAKDVLEIITVFFTRCYGSCSGKKQKLIEGMKKVVEGAEKP